MATAKESVEWLDVEIKQVLPFVLEKEKVIFANMPFLLSKNVCIARTIIKLKITFDLKIPRNA